MTRVSLEGQVAVVTGAARVWASCWPASCRRAARRWRSSAWNRTRSSRSRSSCRENGHWHADVTDHQAMTRVAREVKERFGKVDIVVANAGVANGGPFAESDPQSWRRVVEVNLIGSAVTARAFLPVLLESRGYLLQIASLAAITPAPMMTAYCASKSGVEAFAHSLRARGRAQGRAGRGRVSVVDRHGHGAGRDRDEVMRELRQRLPWPSNKTYPLGPAVDRIVAGIERRSSHVYGQGWLRGMQAVRGWLPGSSRRWGSGTYAGSSHGSRV